jgi:hypothetical protein
LLTQPSHNVWPASAERTALPPRLHVDELIDRLMELPDKRDEAVRVVVLTGAGERDLPQALILLADTGGFSYYWVSLPTNSEFFPQASYWRAGRGGG